jgi:hypothetical protein
VPLTRRTLLLLVFAVLGFALAGAVILFGTLETWSNGRILLTRRRVIPRLITLATDPVEFKLRVLFLASMAGVFLTSSLAGLVGLLSRLLHINSSTPATGFESPTAKLLLLLPLACFIIWFALLVTLPIAYD